MLKILFSTIGILALSFVAYLIIAQPFHNENIRTGSLGYRILIPDYVQQFEIIDKCEEANYRFNGQDGVKPEHTYIVYGTEASFEKITQLYQKQLVDMGCEAKISTERDEEYNYLGYYLKGENCSDAPIMDFWLSYKELPGTCHDVDISVLGVSR